MKLQDGPEICSGTRKSLLCNEVHRILEFGDVVLRLPFASLAIEKGWFDTLRIRMPNIETLCKSEGRAFRQRGTPCIAKRQIWSQQALPSSMIRILKKLRLCIWRLLATEVAHKDGQHLGHQLVLLNNPQTFLPKWLQDTWIKPKVERWPGWHGWHINKHSHSHIVKALRPQWWRPSCVKPQCLQIALSHVSRSRKGHQSHHCPGNPTWSITIPHDFCNTRMAPCWHGAAALTPLASRKKIHWPFLFRTKPAGVGDEGDNWAEARCIFSAACLWSMFCTSCPHSTCNLQLHAGFANDMAGTFE